MAFYKNAINYKLLTINSKKRQSHGHRSRFYHFSIPIPHFFGIFYPACRRNLPICL